MPRMADPLQVGLCREANAFIAELAHSKSPTFGLRW